MVTNKELDLPGAGETQDTSQAGLDKATKEAFMHSGQIDRAIKIIVAKDPWIVNGEVHGRPMITLSLTFDHRLIDGAPPARILQLIAQLINTV